MKFVDGGGDGFVLGGVVGRFFFEVFRLEVNDFFDVGAVLFDERVGTEVEIGVVGGEVDHDTDSAEDGDEHGELDEEREEGAEGLNVVFFV